MLTAHVAFDSAECQKLYSADMAIVLISMFTLVGHISISISFGWILAAFIFIITMSILLIEGFYRVRFDTQFERKGLEISDENPHFATGSIDPFQTISSLDSKTEICERYRELLRKHSGKHCTKKDSRLSSSLLLIVLHCLYGCGAMVI